jgi:hypothetical protein
MMRRVLRLDFCSTQSSYNDTTTSTEVTFPGEVVVLIILLNYQVKKLVKLEILPGVITTDGNHQTTTAQHQYYNNSDDDLLVIFLDRDFGRGVELF